MVNNSYVRLLDAKNNERELCRFNLKEDGSTVTSVLFAELYKENSDWNFKAVGKLLEGSLNTLINEYR